MRLTRREALAAGLRGPDRWLGPLVVAAAGLLVLAWFLPLMTVERFIWWREDLSIAESIFALAREGEYGLFAVLFVFSVLFPAAKLIVCFAFLYRVDATDRRLRRWLAWVDAFGRWSMLDVFVVALAVVAIKISVVSDVVVHAGVYVFIAAVVLSMLAVRRITTLVHARADDG